MNKDNHLIFEAYADNLLKEFPVGLKDWDNPLEPDKVKIKGKEQGAMLKNWSEGTMDKVSLDMIKARTKVFLDSQPVKMVKGKEMRVFPGSYEQFREKLRDIIVDISALEETKLQISRTNAMYAARVIRNVMAHNDNIQHNPKEDKIEIKDTDVDDAVEAGMEAASDAEDKGPERFNRRTEYNVDPLAGDTLPEQHREVVEYVAEQDGHSGQEMIDSLKMKMIFTNPVEKGGLDNNETHLIKVLNDLVTAGVLIPIDESDGGLTDVAGDLEPENPAYAATDYWRRELGGHGLGSGSMDDA
jgi:hypothetical protein